MIYPVTFWFDPLRFQWMVPTCCIWGDWLVFGRKSGRRTRCRGTFKKDYGSSFVKVRQDQFLRLVPPSLAQLLVPFVWRIAFELLRSFETYKIHFSSLKTCFLCHSFPWRKKVVFKLHQKMPPTAPFFNLNLLLNVDTKSFLKVLN